MNNGKLDKQILTVKRIGGRYHTDIYRVKWQGKISVNDMVDYLDSGNFGGCMEYKPIGENLYEGTVTVYTD